MKTWNLFRTKSFLAAGAVALSLATVSHAGLQVPYPVDASTLHLWRFDGPTNTVTTTDEVATASITLTNLGQPVGGPLFTNITLGSASAVPQLNGALHITSSNIAVGNAWAFASGGGVGISNFVNPSSGAFTFEALLKMDGSPFTSSGAWEILCGDNGNNGAGVRGWQFRIVAGSTAQINFNAAAGTSAGVNNISVNLPNSGPNAAVGNQWYHIGLTYTGQSPTNSDPANVLKFYWTLLDANRTHADVLVSSNVLGGFGVLTNVVASLAVGGSGRGNNGTGNGEGFKGYLDEVRMSNVARGSNEMAFVTGGALNAPSFTSQPPTNTFIGYGQTLVLPTLVSGTPTLIYQWQQNGGGGFTNVISQTDSTLALNNATFAAAGDYRLIATNTLGRATSSVAHVTIGAAFSELFHTGVDATNGLPTGGAGIIDPHYQLIESGDLANIGLDATIWNMLTGPLKVNNGRFANPNSVSQWIGPANATASPSGTYVYRTRFVIDQTDLSTAILRGTLWVNLSNTVMLLNGLAVPGLPGANKSDSANFTLTSADGLKTGLNTLDFATTNSATAQDTQSALRVELFGLGQALPAGKPVITNQPVNQIVRDANVGGGSSASFSVVAIGRPPLTYQWRADGSPVADATNRTLTFPSPVANGQGTNFVVVISNDSGSVTSQVAVLTIVGTNQPPLAPNYNLVVYSNTFLELNLSLLLHASSDADNDPLSLGGPPIDPISTNGALTSVAGVIATYFPIPDYLGADQFNYYVGDLFGQTAGSINITVVPVLVPNITSTSTSGNNFVMAGSGGAANGGYHVLSSTDLTVPLANWTPIAAGNFDGTGHFSFTNSLSGSPQRFFLLQIP